MGLKSDLESEVAGIFKTKWSEREGNVVPSDESVKLGNDAVTLSATVLYADLADSTKLVDGHKPYFSAEIYKAFLHCAAKIIRSQDGVITAYDGDRVMAVYIGERKNSRAAKTALSIAWAMQELVVPAKSRQYANTPYLPKHVVGIDTSKLFVARTGVRGANDLVWVGRAANYAAKLAALPEDYFTYITKEVFDVLAPDMKTSNGQSMWEAARWTGLDGRIIYRSKWRWQLN